MCREWSQLRCEDSEDSSIESGLAPKWRLTRSLGWRWESRDWEREQGRPVRRPNGAEQQCTVWYVLFKANTALQPLLNLHEVQGEIEWGVWRFGILGGRPKVTIRRGANLVLKEVRINDWGCYKGPLFSTGRSWYITLAEPSSFWDAG